MLDFQQNIILISIICVLVCKIIIVWIFFLRYRREKKLKEKENSARIAVMLSQIQPHFLYNSLAVIKHLCTKDPQAAQETVVEFSDYLRGNIDALTHNEPIPFEKELHHVKVYLKIEKRRFEDRLNIAYDIQTQDFMIPTLTLQPIVENAVRHGVTKKENGGTVTIRTEMTEKGYIITVTDDGTGFDSSKQMTGENAQTENESVRVGVDSVRNRLAVMCGGTLDIKSVPEAGTTAIITIPGS